MTYCTKCGTKNDDTADYCKKCGAPLKTTQYKKENEWDKRCEEECAGSRNGRGWTIFWGLIIILVGIWIVFEIVLKNLANDIPELGWVNTVVFPFWWVIIAVFAIMLMITGFRIIFRTK
ncbi:MAG: zinc-ribbon domain-containing protein [Candidatus Thermoplasmatota archaeon]|nr:zinc-ribbon domain-containing protein [Candidatus Thermoplasmatota archaeon]MBU1940304.1 zinc-ribbon domain-containing protein [Candidatus Thermoplasmatota archaeon]